VVSAAAEVLEEVVVDFVEVEVVDLEVVAEVEEASGPVAAVVVLVEQVKVVAKELATEPRRVTSRFHY
jgi:hypothetical protein